MIYPELIKGKLIKRYKRFLADIILSDNTIVTAHCPNTGKMTQCNIPDSTVLLSKADNPKRKLKYTWEFVLVNNFWVCVNTGTPNKLIAESIKEGNISELSGYNKITPEVKYGENSRIDLLLEDSNSKKCYVEIKNCTLSQEKCALFPDAVTKRGQKHLKELSNVVDNGDRGVILFAVSRGETECFSPAKEIDPEYAKLLKEVVRKDVEPIAIKIYYDSDRRVLKTGETIPVLI